MTKVAPLCRPVVWKGDAAPEGQGKGGAAPEGQGKGGAAPEGQGKAGGV